MNDQEPVDRRGVLGSLKKRWREARLEEATRLIAGSNADRRPFFDGELLQFLERRATRRTVLKAGAAITLAAATEPLQNAINEDRKATREWNRRGEELLTPGIGFLDGQEGGLINGQTDSLCLVFAGAASHSGRRLAVPLANELGILGAVAYVNYGNKPANNYIDKVGVREIAADIMRYKNVKKLTIYGTSIGAQIAAEVMRELEKNGSPIKLEYLLMDSTPPDVSYTDFPWTSQFIDLLDDADGSTTVTRYINQRLYNDPDSSESAPPRLNAAQGMFLKNGLRHLRYLSDVVKRHGTRHVAFLRVATAEKDDTIDPDRSQKRLEQGDLFPNMKTFAVSGSETNGVPDPDHRETHGDPDLNGIGYRETLLRMLKEWGLI